MCCTEPIKGLLPCRSTGRAYTIELGSKLQKPTEPGNQKSGQLQWQVDQIRMRILMFRDPVTQPKFDEWDNKVARKITDEVVAHRC